MRSMVEGQPRAMSLLGCPSTTGCAGGPPPRAGEDLIAKLSYTRQPSYTRAMSLPKPRPAPIPAAPRGERLRRARTHNFGNFRARIATPEARA